MLAFAPASNLYSGYSYRRPSPFSVPEPIRQPRHTYLAALAEERAAEARHLASLANEEALRQERVAAREQALFDSLYGNDLSYPFEHSHNPYLARRSTFDPYSDDQLLLDDDLSRLRLLLAHNELARRQQEENRRAALRRQFEAGREQRQLAFLRQRQEREDAIRQCQEYSCQRNPGQSEDAVEPVLSLLFGGRPRHVARRHGCRKACGAQQTAELKGHPSRPDLFALIFGDQSKSDEAAKEQQPNTQSTSQPAPSAPVELASSKAAAIPSDPKEKHETNPEVDFRDTIHTLLRAFAPSAQRASSQAAPKTAPTPTPSPAVSLKEQLETRLYNDPDVEVRDTIQAIIASLFTPAAGAGPAAKDSKTDPADNKGKGKAKEVSFEIPVKDRTSKDDVSSALDAVRKIEASFFALESDFAFPATLDLDTDATSTPPSPTGSDTSSLNSIERKLAYSARNAPVRYYQHALNALLAQLDAIESHGSEVVRERRKVVVDRVENSLEDVERKVVIMLGKDLASPAHSSEQVQPAEVPTPAAEAIDTVVEPTATATSIVSDADAPLATQNGQRENVETTSATVIDEKVTDSTPEVVAVAASSLPPTATHQSSSKDTEFVVETGSIVNSGGEPGTTEPTEVIVTVASYPSPTTTTTTTVVDAPSVILSLPVPSDPTKESTPADAFLLNVPAIEPSSLSKIVDEGRAAPTSDGEDLVDLEEDTERDAASDGETWLEVDA